MKLKICGMKDSKNILEVSQLLPDYMGFIFWEKSPRFFNGTIPEIPDTIQRVGVFVDAPFEDIIAKIKLHQLNIVQLHGSEDAAFCQNLKIENIQIIKVFTVDENFSFDILKSFENVVTYYLFDTKGKLPGGNGTTFNWEILQKYNSTKPFFLSGGIGIEEMEKIKKLHLPIHALDVNSRFETEPGIKNASLLKTFQNTIKNELSR